MNNDNLKQSLDSLASNRPLRKKSKSKSGMGTGISTIVTILVVLMLAVFSVLSFSQSHSEMKFSNMSVDTVKAYYEADTKAQEWLAAVDYLAKYDSANLAQTVMNYDGKISTASNGNTVAERAFKIDDNRNLVAGVEIDSSGNIKIIQWQTVTINS